MSPGFLPLLGLVLATGIAALGWETEGFRVATSEGARQLAVERWPAPLPNVRLRDQNGNTLSLGEYRGKTVLVDFIYTRCPIVCGVLGDDFHRVLRLARSTAENREVAAALGVAWFITAFIGWPTPGAQAGATAPLLPLRIERARGPALSADRRRL